MLASRAIAVILLATLSAAGCSLLAKKTDTPADDLNPEELRSRPVPEGERYYTVLFGSINKLHQPAHSHTWASLIRVKQLPGQPQPEIETRTISWMPATLKIKPASRIPETGVNLSLEDSVRIMKEDGQTVEMWGPYEVRQPIWIRFSVQKAFLETGKVGYQCIDTWGESARLGNGCDCIHAITDMDPAYARSRYPLAWFGPPATEHVVRRIADGGGFVNAPPENDWLLGPLNLTDCKIVRREHRTRTGHFENK